jgi:hypothetical protein
MTGINVPLRLYWLSDYRSFQGKVQVKRFLHPSGCAPGFIAHLSFLVSLRNESRQASSHAGLVNREGLLRQHQNLA